jgi:hypothetical protein
MTEQINALLDGLKDGFRLGEMHCRTSGFLMIHHAGHHCAANS